jgi:hypothetical protein
MRTRQRRRGGEGGDDLLALGVEVQSAGDAPF